MLLPCFVLTYNGLLRVYMPQITPSAAGRCRELFVPHDLPLTCQAVGLFVCDFERRACGCGLHAVRRALVALGAVFALVGRGQMESVREAACTACADCVAR